MPLITRESFLFIRENKDSICLPFINCHHFQEKLTPKYILKLIFSQYFVWKNELNHTRVISFYVVLTYSNLLNIMCTKEDFALCHWHQEVGCDYECCHCHMFRLMFIYSLLWKSSSFRRHDIYPMNPLIK